MKEIIRKEYQNYIRQSRHLIRDDEDMFNAGWMACEEWQAEQDAREKDDKQEQEDLEHLYRGDF